MKKKALITGISGQTGSFMADFLLEKDYEVYGILRRTSTKNLERIAHILDRVCLIPGDVTDQASMDFALKNVQPDECYHLAAQSVTEDELVPVMHAKGIQIRSFGELWETLIAKNEAITQTVEGIETEIIQVRSEQVRALGYLAGMGQWMPITQITRHWYHGNIVRLKQKWGSIAVTPNHSVYDYKGNLCNALSNPILLPMRKMNYYHERQIAEVSIKPHGVFAEDDTHFWRDKKPEVRCPKILSGDGLWHFLNFVAAYIAEGCCHIHKSHGQHTVTISNTNKNWLQDKEFSLKQIIPGLSSFWTENRKNGYYKTVYNLCFSDKLLYTLMAHHCLVKSKNVKLPDFTFSLARDLRELLLRVLVEGDGSIVERKNCTLLRYGTTSRVLATQICLLLSMHGKDYMVNEGDQEDPWNIKYDIRQVQSYQFSQGIDARKICEIPYDGYVYDITVAETENFTVGFGNVVVHNSYVGVSWGQPELTLRTNVTGTLRVLEAIRKFSPQTKMYFAASSEMWGKVQEIPQKETTPFYPRSPYGVSKVAAYWLCVNYRESYNLFVSCGICANHESERRGFEFVTRKISDGVARIKLGMAKELYLGNLEARRDWSYAGDFVRGIWLMLQQQEPDDFVLASGVAHSVRDFASAAFGCVDLYYGDYVKTDETLLRPAEVDLLVGDAGKARRVLGWQPEVSFHELVRRMVDADMNRLKNS